MSSEKKRGRVGELFKASLSFLMILGLATGPVAADENANLTLKSIKDANIRLYGFVENDLIHDTKQLSTFEELDNVAVPKASTVAGQNGRTIMSIRNSRLGIDLTIPKTESGYATEGVFEIDAVGNQAANTTPGTGNGSNDTAGAQSERDFYNNPTLRIRHAYVSVTKDDKLNLKVGQTWSLLGWQDYYFPSEYNVQPAVGQLYRRMPQIRLTDTAKFGDESIESALDAAKPAQENSEVTEFHGGLRWADNALKGATMPGSGTKMVALSVGLSGAIIPVRSDAGNATGSAIAADLFVPIIPSKDGKDNANNLGLTAEYQNGRGTGGLELAGLTSGVQQVTSATLPGANATIDSGIAGVSNSSHMELIHFQTWRTNLVYTLPNPHYAVGGGYAEAMCLNAADFSKFGGTGVWPRDQYYFSNLMWQPLGWLRFALSLSQVKTTYNDAHNRFGYDTRSQFTTYLVF